MAAAIGAGLQKGILNPVVGKEYELSKAPEAHKDIIESSGAKGKLVLVPWWKHREVLLEYRHDETQNDMQPNCIDVDWNTHEHISLGNQTKTEASSLFWYVSVCH